MPITPEEREATRRRLADLDAELARRAKGAMPLRADAPTLSSYAEDAPGIQGDPSLDPTVESWWGREG